MVRSPDKPVEEEEEIPVESSDQDPKVQTFKDTVDFPSLDSYLDYDSCNWLGNNPSIKEFSVEDKDFDFFDNEMEIGQEGVSASEETSLGNQNAVMFESVEERSELCGESSEKVGVSSTTAESMMEVEPELCGGMTEDIGASSTKTDSLIEAERNLSDDMSANLDGVAEPAVKELEPTVSDNSRPMEYGAPSVACPTGVGLASCIEVGLEKVSLTMGDDDEKSDGAKGKSINIAESESETSSSSSSSGDSNSSEEESDEQDNEEEGNKKTKKDQMVIGKEDDVAEELEEGEIQRSDEEHEVEEDEDYDDDDDEVNEMVAWNNDEVYKPIRSKNELKELPPVPAVDVTLKPHHITLPVGAVLSVVSTKVIVEGTEKHIPLNEGSILWITERRTPLGLVDEIFGPVESPYYIVRFNSESEVPEGVSEGTPISFVEDFAQHITNIEELQKKKGYDASGVNDEEVSDEVWFSDDEKEAEYIRKQKMEKRNKNRALRRPTSSYSGEWTENQGSSSLSSNPHIDGPHQPRSQMDSFSSNRGAWRPRSYQQNPFQSPPIPNQMVMPNLLPMQIPLFQPQFNSWPALVGQNLFNQQPFGMGRGFQMHQPQFQTYPQLPMNPRFNMLNPRPQSSMNPQSQVPQFPTNLQPTVQQQSQGFSTRQSSERGRGHRGRGRGRGRGRLGRG